MAVTETAPSLATLRTDLAAFGDPGEEVRVERGRDGVVDASWTQHGRAAQAQILLGSQPSLIDARVRFDGSETSYPSFLASTPMADLRSVARNTTAVLASPQAFVAPKGTFEGGEESADTLVDRLARPTMSKTAVVFLTADAGDGKTTLLKHLAVDRAESFSSGSEERVWLYVDAQGSRLARLEQALAQALDEVRAPFPYHATESLVRVGAVVLIIDGFDELIGTSASYDEAYGSLSAFLQRLDGNGAVVAAARSAYYEQEFAARVDRSIGFRSEGWDLRPVRLLDWQRSERTKYVEKELERQHRKEDVAEVIETLEDVFADPQLEPLAGKPLFVSRIADLVLEHETLAEGTGPLDRLVSTYVDREVDKLPSASGAPLLTNDLLRELLSELAQEMWREEARTLSRTTVRELASLFAELHGLEEDAAAVLIERLPYVAFLRVGSDPGSVAFEHELFFAYFLVQPLAEALASESGFLLMQALSRGRLPQVAGDLAGRELRGRPPSEVLARLSAAGEGGASPSLRQNAGLIALGFIRGQAEPRGLLLRHFDVVDVDCQGLRLIECVLDDVEISGADLRGASFLRCRGHNLRLRDIRVDGATILDLADVPVSSVTSAGRYADDGGYSLHYAPAEIAEVLADVGFPAAVTGPQVRAVDSEVVDVLQQLSRVYDRTSMVTEEDDNVLARLTQHKSWSILRDALLESEVVSAEKRPAAGTKIFLRIRFRPGDVLLGQDPDADVSQEVRRLWDILEAEAPSDPK